jgi:periplasmic divalent cation tolerance protein
MNSARKYQLVLVTSPDMKTARNLARAALKARLIACANLVPRIESHYWWRGKINRSMEALIVMKTLSSRLNRLEKLVLDQHPYETPEFIVVGLSGGNRRYLRWLGESCLASHRG